MNIKVVIPFRDRGLDPRRTANLETVMTWWWAHNLDPVVVDDGLSGDAQFNRHRAYNRAVDQHPDTDVFVFSEADMLIGGEQISRAIADAALQPGLVVPFTQYRYLSDNSTGFVRHLFNDLRTESLAEFMTSGELFDMPAESIMDDGKSIGAVNVVSRETLKITGGFTEATSGNWYDDNIVEEGFAFLTGSATRFVPGPAVHLYHLPGWKGDHLTDQDRAATENNKRLLNQMRWNIRSHKREPVQRLLSYREDAR